MTIIPKSQIEEVHIALSQYQGKHLIDIRSYMSFNGDAPSPTKKGVSLPVTEIDKVIAGLQAAKAEAIQKGLLK